MADDKDGGTRLTAVEIHENIVGPGKKELTRPAASLLWSALASGLVIGFSFIGSAYAASLVPPERGHAAFAAVYPLGFILVIMARSELFTENTLVPVDPVSRAPRCGDVPAAAPGVGAAAHREPDRRRDLRLGPRAHAHGRAVTPRGARRLAAEATSGSFGRIVYAGVFAGWLIALLSWLLASTHATGAQIVLIWICTAPIAALGFRHSIAGSVEAFYRAASGGAGWGEMLLGFVLPAVIGNAIGGVLLVALLNYGQVVTEREDEPPSARKRRRRARHRQGEGGPGESS